MSSSHVQTPAARKAASSQQATLDALAGIVGDYTQRQLSGMAARMSAALADQSAPDGDARDVYRRVKSARLLKDNAYAFLHVTAGAIDRAVRRELAALAPDGTRQPAGPLGLVPLEDIDNRLALGARARPFEIAYAEGLATLAVRLGLLLGRGALRAEANPFRPEVFLGAIEEAWREFEPDAEAHDLVQPLLRPDIVFDFAQLLDELAGALRAAGQPGAVDAYRIQKTDDTAAARAARAVQRAALAEQLRKLFGDDGGDDGVPLIPDLPAFPAATPGAGGWRPSGAVGFGTAPAPVDTQAGAAPDGAGPADAARPGGRAAVTAADAAGHAPGAAVQPGTGYATASGAATQPGIATPGVATPGMIPPPGMASAAGFIGAAGASAQPGMGFMPAADHGHAGWYAAVHGALAGQIGTAPLLDLLARIEPALAAAPAPAVEADFGPAAGVAGGPAAPAAPPPDNVFYLPRLAQSLPRGSLPRADERTLGLLSRVFETVLLDDSIPARTRELLQLLQVPVLKAALLDKNFFFEETHPARRLVDLLSRTGWEQRDDPDDPLFCAMQRSVARAGEAQPDAFAGAVAELEAGLAADAAAQEAALAAPVATALRQEKHEVAARQARDAVALRVEAGDVVDVVGGFLEQRWTTVLTFAYTIEETRPGAVGNATRAMDDLIWSVKPKATQEQRKALIARLPRLLSTLNKWLDAIKWQDADRLQFFARLAEYHASIVRAPIELAPERQLELAVEAARQDALRRVELENAAAEQAAARAAEMSVVDDLERGMWFEFRADGGARKVKLAWVSPLRTLFIFSGAGRKEAFSLSADKLAAALHAGRARMLAIDGVVGQVLSEAVAQGATNDPAMAMRMP